ncbi:type II toxin-antitoxin system VapB family antitoxin [Endozoicomonas acroporae]|uniref:type II toxin-antitoxin system VapB family antitoxin n=1 Tax=Endozoicomonas acroporae TaxID=1701104 RepID=UPI001FCFC5A1|nr:type II toxin-antitoxin system VapB family antitoxin [Endozoicomonas acroporae]
MRKNIVIDDELMQEALNASGLTTKKEAVEAGLKALIQLKSRKKSEVSWQAELGR